MADESEGDEVNSEEKLSLKVTEYLDNVVGTNISGLSKVESLLDSTQKKEKELKKKLDDAKHSTPVKVQEAIENGKSASKNIKDFQSQRESFIEKAEIKVQKIKPLAEHLSHLADQIADIERFRTYISWIQKLEAVSNGIQENLEAGLLGPAVDQFSILAAVANILESSSCDNLKAFSQEMQVFWRRVLIEKLSSEFSQVTQALKWPFTSLSTAPPLSTTSETYKTLERLFLLLLKLQDFKIYDENISKVVVNKDKEIPLPIDWLLKPLRKRFRFHFYGKKQTNDLGKPEWFFTQVLNWIKSHGDFIQHTVQPIFDKAGLEFIDAKFEFIHGLLKVTVEKMEHCVPLLLTDDSLFSHFVDETLLFHQEVHNLYDYPASDHQCLSVLVSPKCLDKWVELERRYAKENLDSLVRSPTAWRGKYQDVGGEVDETRTPECAEGFVTLLTVITDRYKDLPTHDDQMRFLEVQLGLLQDFFNQLNEKKEEYSSDPVDPLFLSVLNAAHFTSYVLEDWMEQAIFLQLHEQSLSHAESDSPEEDVSTGVFDVPIQQLQTLQTEMKKMIVDNVTKDFKVKSLAYKKERWHSLPSPKDLAVMSLSSGACEFLLFLKDRLKRLERQLARALFSTLWQNLAQELNKIIYTQIILECHYNEGGAAQLQFDMTKHLFTLFGEYTSKPENYFKQVKECCILLNQLPGSTILIKEALNNSDDTNSSPKATLNELGVYRLTPEEALRVLSLRINWSKT